MSISASFFATALRASRPLRPAGPSHAGLVIAALLLDLRALAFADSETASFLLRNSAAAERVALRPDRPGREKRARTQVAFFRFCQISRTVGFRAR